MGPRRKEDWGQDWKVGGGRCSRVTIPCGLFLLKTSSGESLLAPNWSRSPRVRAGGRQLLDRTRSSVPAGSLVREQDERRCWGGRGERGWVTPVPLTLHAVTPAWAGSPLPACARTAAGGWGRVLCWPILPAAPPEGFPLLPARESPGSCSKPSSFRSVSGAACCWDGIKNRAPVPLPFSEALGWEMFGAWLQGCRAF